MYIWGFVTMSSHVYGIFYEPDLADEPVKDDATLVETQNLASLHAPIHPIAIRNNRNRNRDGKNE